MADESTTGTDWMQLFLDMVGGFSVKGEKSGSPNWKAIERLMALDAEANRTNRHGMFSNWDWSQGEDGTWTQSNTPVAGMGGGMDYLQDRLNGAGFDYFDSPEQFNSLLDGKMANQMDRQGILSEMPDLLREFGEGSADQYANPRTFMDGKDYTDVVEEDEFGGGENIDVVDDITGGSGGRGGAVVSPGGNIGINPGGDPGGGGGGGSGGGSFGGGRDSGRNGAGGGGRSFMDWISQGGDWTVLEKLLQYGVPLAATSAGGPLVGAAAGRLGGDWDIFQGKMNNEYSENFVGPDRDLSNPGNIGGGGGRYGVGMGADPGGNTGMGGGGNYYLPNGGGGFDLGNTGGGGGWGGMGWGSGGRMGGGMGGAGPLSKLKY